MTRSQLALSIVGTATGLGVLGSIFLADAPWGFGFTIWMACLLAAGYAFALSTKTPVALGPKIIAVHMMAFAVWFGIRDSEELRTLNLCAIALILGIVCLRSREGQLWRASVADYTGKIAVTLGHSVLHPFLLAIEDIEWKTLGSTKAGSGFASISRGLLIAVPIVAVFGGLLASADSGFSSFLTNLVNVDVEEVFLRGSVGTFTTFATIGIFRQVFIYGQRTLAAKPETAEVKQPWSIGITELAIVFVALDVLFLLFVGIQFKRLFGDSAVVLDPNGPSYAEYAKQGFFQLVWVSGLGLALILGANAVINRAQKKHVTLFRFLAIVMVLLLFVVMASAANRLSMYVNAYGLTTQRVYGAAALAWLGLSFVWLLGTALRGTENRFAFGSVLAGLATIFALNAINPDLLVASTNLKKMDKIDMVYLSSLSADAAPAVRQSLPTNPQKKMAQELLKRWAKPAGFAGTNLARLNAAHLSQESSKQ